MRLRINRRCDRRLDLLSSANSVKAMKTNRTCDRNMINLQFLTIFWQFSHNSLSFII
ncbi:hypothetical protein [Cylindrospermopsis sp. CR12]|uniref:hypothetical protein n=1 Tax=Cylindrospermopsis sp. CR12 TaxID=1747196 RepID=UPI0012FE30E6|nr:hypothetical protein [Cylindrospermopsis sp. CR12]MBU6346236.1 hypothetical protein [Cyanobacteria bacterium REEB494]